LCSPSVSRWFPLRLGQRRRDVILPDPS
jgi:hypothetical protein